MRIGICIPRAYSPNLRNTARTRRKHTNCPLASTLAGSKVKLKTCSFLNKSIIYLGYAISRRQLHLTLHAAGGIRGMKPSTSFTKLCSFLGVSNVFKEYVQIIVRIVAQLHQRIKNDQRASFVPLKSDNVQSTYTFQTTLIYPAIFTLNYSGNPMMHNTDACNAQIGCVLVRKQPESTTKAIKYLFRSLPSAERRYKTTRRKLQQSGQSSNYDCTRMAFGSSCTRISTS